MKSALLLFALGAGSLLSASDHQKVGDCSNEAANFLNAAPDKKRGFFPALLSCVRATPRENLPNAGYKAIFQAYANEQDELLKREELGQITTLRICGKDEINLFVGVAKNEKVLKLREFAVGGLMMCGQASQSAASDLIGIFDQSPPISLKKNIVYALGGWGSRDSPIAAFLIQVASSEPNGSIRRAASDALKRWQVVFKADPIDSLLTNPPTTPDALGSLIKIVQESGGCTQEDVYSISDRAKVLDTDRELALRRLAEPSNIMDLIKQYHDMLSNPMACIRDVSAYALGKTGDVSAIEDIRKNLFSVSTGTWEEHWSPTGDWFRAGLNINALIELGDCGWVPQITEYPITAPSWSMTLAKCKKEAKPVLEKAMTSGMPNLEQAARRTYRELYE